MEEHEGVRGEPSASHTHGKPVQLNTQATHPLHTEHAEVKHDGTNNATVCLQMSRQSERM